MRVAINPPRVVVVVVEIAPELHGLAPMQGRVDHSGLGAALDAGSAQVWVL